MKDLIRQNRLQWLLLGLAWGVAIILGVTGFTRYAAGHNLSYSLWDKLYLVIQLIPLNSGALPPRIPLALNLARFLIPLLAGATVIKAAWELFRQQIWEARLKRLRGHVIICGLSRKGMLLANRFREQGEQVVVIEKDEKNPWLETCRKQAVYVLSGDATDGSLLRSAGVARARGLFAVCDDSGLNVEIALRAQEMVQERVGEPLTCLVNVSDPSLCALLREQEASLEMAPFRLEMFNVFERGARRMLQTYPAWTDQHISGNIAPRILIVGLGWMGENLLVHAARDWWNARQDNSIRLQALVVDRYARRKSESLHARYPCLGEACDLVPYEMEIHSAAFENASFLRDANGQPAVDIVYICVDSDSLGLHAALTLRRQLRDKAVKIVVRMAENSGLARLLTKGKNRATAYPNIHGFSYLETTCTPELLSVTIRDTLARAAHEDYSARQAQAGVAITEDPALQPWERLSAFYRHENYNWVDRITQLVDSVGCKIVPLTDWNAPSFQFTQDEIDQMAPMEHALWMQQRLQAGWTYAAGPKSLELKTHPDLVPWQDLSESEKIKNIHNVAAIPRALALAGFQIERVKQESQASIEKACP